MNFRRSLLVLGAALAIGAGGCGGDIAQQLVSNEQIRTQVLDALTQHQDLAFQAVDKFLASDSLRVPVVDHMLKNSDAAKQVLVRIGTNPEALDLVLQVAVQDSATRVHVQTLMKGMAMASPHK